MICGGEIRLSLQKYSNTCCSEHGRLLALRHEPKTTLVKTPVVLPTKRKPARKPRYVGGNPTKQSLLCSKYRGVKRHYKGWMSTCACERVYYGHDEFLAALAYDRAALRQYGHKAILNYRVT